VSIELFTLTPVIFFALFRIVWFSYFVFFATFLTIWAPLGACLIFGFNSLHFWSFLRFFVFFATF